jgi:hypothetical protein
VLPDQIWKTPDVAQAKGNADHRHDQPEARGKRLAHRARDGSSQA